MKESENKTENKAENNKENKSDNKKLKIVIAALLAVIAVLIVLIVYFARSAKSPDKEAESETVNQTSSEEAVSESKEDTAKKDSDTNETSQTEEVLTPVYAANDRPSILSNTVELVNPEYTVNTAPYKAEKDFSNVDNGELYMYMRDVDKEQLAEDYFYVDQGMWDEFFEVYEINRYNYEANFVTVDSLMHTYHLYFAHLLKNLEKNELAGLVSDMSVKLLEESNNQYDALKGTEWEEAAKRNVEFFAIASVLQGNTVSTAVDVSDAVKSEISKILAAEEIEKCVITDEYEDYTQYVPRGYYEGDDKLEAYFRTMMWYGRIQFNTKSEEMIKSAMLMNIALNTAGSEEWEDIYDITSFFTGASDDLSYYEYYPLLQSVYGEEVSVEKLLSDKSKLSVFSKEVEKLRIPEINSIPIEMGEDNVIQGYRLMGQRFCIDASVFQKLIYQSVDADDKGNLRMLPDVLDVEAALGSDIAYDLLKQQGDTNYKNYTENMEALREELSGDIADKYMTTNLSSSWLNTLRPLLKEKGEGYPSFMQGRKWATKDLECFAGSYTELKHDTILYAKQAMAEMGGADPDVYDDRGYVQPEPEVYARFMYLAEATKAGLSDRGKLSGKDSDDLKKLHDLAKSLLEISIKELKDETLSYEEYEIIRGYGGTLEHFWYEVASDTLGKSGNISTEEFRAALVADVATDPNGQVLELGTGAPCSIYVVVKVDGKIKIARGSVFSFYQFAWPLDNRLTDTKWREMMHFEPGEDGWYSDEEPPVERIWWSKDYLRKPWE